MSNLYRKFELDQQDLRLSKLVSEARSALSKAPLNGLITVGLELEIFLRNKSNELVSLEESQEFLNKLSKLKSWNIYSRNPFSNYITRVSCELGDGKYHSVKYEHPPHMIEVALSYFEDLHELKTQLEKVLNDLENAANSSNLKLDIKASSEAPMLNWSEINLIEDRFEQLSKSRNLIFQKNHQSEPDLSKINFSSYNAATQIHIGGIRWWECDPHFMSKIYRSEFLISGASYTSISQFISRWSAYQYVFGHMKLLGFPLVSEMSFESWIQNMDQDNPVGSDLFKMRDLQIIKPKWIGTLEFRSDPAMDNVNKIISQTSLRLASYLNSMKPGYMPPINDLSIEQLGVLWHEGAHVGSFFKEEFECLKEDAWATLKARGKGEEGLL